VVLSSSKGAPYPYVRLKAPWTGEVEVLSKST
jgi:hypothetical protein